MYNLLLMAVLATLSQTSASNKDGIPGSDLPKMRTGHLVSITSVYDQAIENYGQKIKVKISPTLRSSVPCELLITSGFTPGEQNNLDMAGCYIRLGSSLRKLDELPNNLSLAAKAFMNSGTFYVAESMSAEDPIQRLDFLTSAAQCYYWAFFNESNLTKKQTLKDLALRYYSEAQKELDLTNDMNQRSIWEHTINQGKQKLL